jgi:hypothetical protein
MLSARTVSMGNARAALKDRGDDVYETPPVAVEALLQAEKLPPPICGSQVGPLTRRAASPPSAPTATK